MSWIMFYYVIPMIFSVVISQVTYFIGCSIENHYPEKYTYTPKRKRISIHIGNFLFAIIPVLGPLAITGILICMIVKVIIVLHKHFNEWVKNDPDDPENKDKKIPVKETRSKKHIAPIKSRSEILDI